jgi:hypothetical protein
MRPVGAELFHADRQTDGRTTERRADKQADGHDKTNRRFSRFCERAYRCAENFRFNGNKSPEGGSKASTRKVFMKHVLRPLALSNATPIK